jgi:hypothetical protein
LSELIFEAVIEGKEEQARLEIERALDSDQVRARLAAQARKVELSPVRAVLKELQDWREVAEMRRMMPAYARRFFQLAAPLVGAGIRGEIEGEFWLDPCPASVQQALESYPDAIRRRLTFDRERAMPDLARDPEAIYLHPGEPVYEAVVDLFLDRYEHQGLRGAIFLDPAATEPYLFCLAKAAVLRDPDGAGRGADIVRERMTGVRRGRDGSFEFIPAHQLLTLTPADEQDVRDVDVGGWGALDTAPVEAYLVEAAGLPLLEAARAEEEGRLPAQVEQMRVAFNLRKGDLLRQRKLLRDAVERDVPAAGSKLRACEAELQELDGRRRQGEADLYASVDRLRLGPASIYAQALVLPMPPEDEERRTDAWSEAVALAEVIRREEAIGSVVEDVSDPHLKAGFDLKVLRPDGAVRYVEVKGRKGRQAVELTENEWAQAANHPDRYWLYVVYNCDAVPELHHVPDPFGRLLASHVGSMRVNAVEVLRAAA